MASSVLVPVEEYLETVYRPDCDYVDGELRERNSGEQPHSDLVMILGSIFSANRTLWGVRPLADQRVQITSTRYRIPDVCILRNTDPKDLIITFPPLLCIEILSRGDSLGELQERVNDYASIGVTDIWAIDPWKRLGYHASIRGFDRPTDGVLRVQNSAITVSLADLFQQLDES